MVEFRTHVGKVVNANKLKLFIFYSPKKFQRRLKVGERGGGILWRILHRENIRLEERGGWEMY